MRTDAPRWLPDTAAGLAVLALGLLEAANRDNVTTPRTGLALVALMMACAVAMSRHAPGAALGLTWGIGVLQVVNGVDLMLVELAIAVVAFGCARWGSTATVWLSVLSIPAAALIAVVYVGLNGLGGLVEDAGFQQLVEDRYRYGDTWQIGAAVIGMALLGVPWLAGLALRFVARAQSSRVSQEHAEEEAAEAVRESEQAREIARLREEQARLARDVHDVVGHSLAVILAQAESAQYLSDLDSEKLKTTMENIATSARSSLQDVRHVLTPADRAEPTSSAGLDELIAGVRTSGHEVVSSEVGVVQPLPPELEVVAFRVLQEMLTNAMRHGRRDEPVFVERHWPDGGGDAGLRIEVRNVVDPAAQETPPGQGLDGMRRRLESVGGRLDVRQRATTEGETFTVTAWVPVRSGAA
ncbi:histidine kinase [Nocardioides sp. cx-169]|uniref:sensor histidine kinase n=1 Tax=Nocardioides sp. cx-169 TaxID=2899080 RepID=UPI001E49720B|nr:histidine kinase [Nocardioides sp. cx-169]MCD4534104.1 histidine kinase [Nocardioides sp. cx-169]